MARTFTIDPIDGNSNLGNPVFSNYGKMQNYQYLVLSPVKEDDVPHGDDGSMPLSSENMQFQIKKNMMDGSGGNATAATLSMQEKRQQIHDILVSIQHPLKHSHQIGFFE